MNSRLWKVLVTSGVWVLVGCGGQPGQGADALHLGKSRQAVLAACNFTTPAVDMDKELVVKDITVVNDLCRTKFSGGSCVSPSSAGKWSFGYLMSQMAGNRNPADTSAFVLDWLHTWETTQTVNGVSLPARPGITALIVNTWRTKSGCAATGPCTLDFNQAPFRLLAIVNRLDLVGPGDPYSPNNPSPGELRFVFGFIDLNKLTDAASGQGKLNATVIFEYKLNSSLATIEWAYAWDNLRTLSFGTEAFNSQLESITNRVTAFDPVHNLTNGSAIGQVRTNEIAFDTALMANRVWELRQQQLVCPTPTTCALAPAQVSLTPDNSFNKSALLDSFMLSNASALANEDLSGLPTAWFSGASRSKGALGSQLIWDLSDAEQTQYIPNGGSFDPLNRHHLALATCNGCHYAETGTSNFHIGPRAAGVATAPSLFLGGSNALDPLSTDSTQPANYVSVTDPVSFDTRVYNDAWRRKCELQRILWDQPTPLFKRSGAH